MTLTLIEGDCADILPRLPAHSAGLVVTSPPYYNARPEYAAYDSYEDYLRGVAGTCALCREVLAPGRFLVVNTSSVIVARSSRSEDSTRFGIPHDLHPRIVASGFDFIDDIIWRKPSGAGWNAHRGRRFSADRQPFQYKSVPVTEHVMVYRASGGPRLDDLIASCRDRIAGALVESGYEATNVWDLQPETGSWHPAPMPFELACRLIRLYSVPGDVVVDPYAGSGTAGRAAIWLGRAALLIERDPETAMRVRRESAAWHAVHQMPLFAADP